MPTIYSVGRVRAIHPKNGMGFITHNFKQHLAFYFSNYHEFVNRNGTIIMGNVKSYHLPDPGDFVIFDSTEIKYPSLEENSTKGWIPRIEKWGTTASYKEALSEKFLKVLKNGKEVFIGGIGSFKGFMENTNINEDELEIHFV
jgi:hypothetical protein